MHISSCEKILIFAENSKLLAYTAWQALPACLTASRFYLSRKFLFGPSVYSIQYIYIHYKIQGGGEMPRSSALGVGSSLLPGAYIVYNALLTGYFLTNMLFSVGRLTLCMEVIILYVSRVFCFKKTRKKMTLFR